MYTQTYEISTRNDFVSALSDELLALTGYGIHAYLSPIDIRDRYLTYRQSPMPMNSYAQAIIKHE